jgi:hypothetical protein
MTVQYLTLLSFLVSGGAFIISALTFRRNRRLENENHLYKLKTDTYNLLTRKVYELVAFYEDVYFKAKDQVESGSMEKIDFDRLADDIDLKGYYLEKEVACQSLLLPATVLTTLEDFLDLVIYDAPEEEPTLEYMNDTLLRIYSKAEEVINTFRVDLNVNQLNASLFRRIK